MTPTEFCYWLQGRAELLPDQPPTADEWKMIREHLALAFVKVTPPKQEYAPNKLTGGMDEYIRRVLVEKQAVPQPFPPDRVIC